MFGLDRAVRFRARPCNMTRDTYDEEALIRLSDGPVLLLADGSIVRPTLSQPSPMSNRLPCVAPRSSTGGSLFGYGMDVQVDLQLVEAPDDVRTHDAVADATGDLL